MLEIKKQTEAADKRATITGMVDNKSTQKGKITVVLISSPEKNQFVVEGRITADDDGRYLLLVKPGTYYIAAFIDLDQNGFYSKGEHARVYKNFSPILLVNRQIATANIDITGLPKWSAPSDAKVIERKSLSMSNIGRIVSLDDPMFSIDAGPLGLWRPLDYLDK
ncbi:MAG: hypothetical protein GQ573_09290 [Gammaproteobacteria bacterium]|nr:hypothetical protein [Gammaproteobacteria bacterium]